MRVRWLVALALVVGLTACGDPPDSRSVTEESRAKVPFDGDLAGKRGAERALECSGDVYRTGVGDPEGGLEENGDSPGLGLDHWLDPQGYLHQVPETGYAVETEDGDRVLISYDNESDETVIAFAMRDGQTDYYQDGEGWMVESYAMCDPADWPQDVTDGLDIGVWQDESGTSVPVTTVVSFHGPEHCGWQESTWIWLGEDGADGEFIGNPTRDLRDGLQTTYELDVPVPADARDTGWSHDGNRLLIAEDGSAAYLVSTVADADRTVGDRWPAAKKLGSIRCA